MGFDETDSRKPGLVTSRTLNEDSLSETAQDCRSTSKINNSDFFKLESEVTVTSELGRASSRQSDFVKEDNQIDRNQFENFDSTTKLKTDIDAIDPVT